jgi:Asp-tRNA(Asn)/Glu-tRNA(Gln) amidotransferase A subunit family amidase
LREGVVTAKDICEASLKRAKHIKELNAFVTLTEDLAKDQAEESNNRFEQSNPL